MTVTGATWSMAAFWRAWVCAWSSTWFGRIYPAAISYTRASVFRRARQRVGYRPKVLARGIQRIGGDAVGVDGLESAQGLALQEVVGGGVGGQ